MKLTEGQLRSIINDVLKEETVRQRKQLLRRIDELFAGSSVGSYMKQAVAKLWEADNMVQRALAEADTNDEHKLLTMIHQAIEHLAHNVDDKVQSIMSGDKDRQKKLTMANKKKAPPPSAPPR